LDPKHSRADLASIATGSFLILVGLAYFALLIVVVIMQPPDLSRRTLGVLSFLIALGVLLIWVGVQFLKK
jgi:hypothetical protein